MNQIINKMKKIPVIDQATGEYNLRYNIQNLTEDFFLPVRGGDSGTSIDSLSGLDYDSVEDIEYLKSKLLASLRVPKAFLGYEESLCAVEAGDINDDGILNVLDIVLYLQDILNGTTTQAMAHLQSILTTEEFKKLTEEFYYVGAKFLFAWPNPSNEYMNIAGNGLSLIHI